MNLKKYIFLCLISILFCSCNKEQLIIESTPFEEGEWTLNTEFYESLYTGMAIQEGYVTFFYEVKNFGVNEYTHAYYIEPAQESNFDFFIKIRGKYQKWASIHFVDNHLFADLSRTIGIEKKLIFTRK